MTGTSATLTGVVFANKETITYHFEYGATAAYGTRTPGATVAGNSQRSVSAGVTGLAPLTTYHFRLVAALDRTSRPSWALVAAGFFAVT